MLSINCLALFTNCMVLMMVWGGKGETLFSGSNQVLALAILYSRPLSKLFQLKIINRRNQIYS